MIDRSPRLSYLDIDWLAHRLGVNSSQVTTAEVRELAEYTCWLYAKRGALVERLEQLHADGRLDLRELVELYRIAEWSEADGQYLADWHDDGHYPRYWRPS
jgi:hypothetical protein